MAAKPKDDTLRAAYAPYLNQIRFCLCATCQAVVTADRWLTLTFRGRNSISTNPAHLRAYRAAISAQLRELVEHRHHRVDLADLQRPGQIARPFPHVSISDGIGVGVGGWLDMHRGPRPTDRSHPYAEVAAYAAVLAGETPPPSDDPPVVEGDQFTLFAA